MDFLLHLEGTKFAIEAKAAEEVVDDDASALTQVKAYLPDAKAYIFHSGTKARKVGGIWALPLAEGLEEIGL